jgi:transcription termination factor NusB
MFSRFFGVPQAKFKQVERRAKRERDRRRTLEALYANSLDRIKELEDAKQTQGQEGAEVPRDPRVVELLQEIKEAAGGRTSRRRALIDRHRASTRAAAVPETPSRT